MAAKRTATSEINHTNWHVEEEREEAGSFLKAPEEIIKNRVIKVARRRNPIGTLATSEGEKKSAFMNFGGFNKISSTSTSSSTPFGFLSNVTNKSEEQPKTNGLANTSTFKPPSTETPNTIFHVPENKTISSPFITGQMLDSEEYYGKLKGLNQSVSSWIKKHVDANPFLNLSPVFRDYEKYLDDIENVRERNETPSTHKDSELKTVTSTTKMETQKIVNTFMSKPSEQNVGENKTSSYVSVFRNTTTTKLSEDEHSTQDKPEKFGFGTRSESAAGSAQTFSFGKSNVQPTTSTAGFSFGSETSKLFTFSNVAKPTDIDSTKGENEEDDEEPPKVEFTPVVEDGHTFTIRCKVFVKKDGQYGDRGVGNLYLKPVPDSDKVQLIVRADTSLGNLLCNFILSTSIPMQRMGKKDVMLVCIPTPDSKPPPVPVLFRVKSPEEADELLRTLEKYKK